ncbi:MAG: hypothetical protein EBR82_67955 [Caulobacteraceae bacterium]|nr:hypothetical protein [Caulobacteraceae bacterium]
MKFKSATPTEYTKDEVRQLFINHVKEWVDYWHNESRKPDTKDKLEGLARSITNKKDRSQNGSGLFRERRIDRGIIPYDYDSPSM